MFFFIEYYNIFNNNIRILDDFYYNYSDIVALAILIIFKGLFLAFIIHKVHTESVNWYQQYKWKNDNDNNKDKHKPDSKMGIWTCGRWLVPRNEKWHYIRFWTYEWFNKLYWSKLFKCGRWWGAYYEKIQWSEVSKSKLWSIIRIRMFGWGRGKNKSKNPFDKGPLNI